MSLVKPLVEGPLDIIGDVHGELQALESLLKKLGYRADGNHPDGRHLVFVGDLTDRGPDSPEVLRRVQGFVERGKAQLVAGNHELNLLRREQKHGNHWFYGVASHPDFGNAEAIGGDEQASILGFLRGLPVALERDDLRVVHAAWDEDAIAACRLTSDSVDIAFQQFQDRLEADPEFRRLKVAYEAERARLGDAVSKSATAPRAVATGPHDERCQMGNPIRVLTSGIERVTNEPFFTSGKWRYLERVPWWKTYRSPVPVIFGHYWRWWDPGIHAVLSKGEPQLFADDPLGPSMTAQDTAFCVDFSVGSRFKQRMQGHEPPYHGRLAALRWPERELVFDAEEPCPVSGLT